MEDGKNQWKNGVRVLLIAYFTAPTYRTYLRALWNETATAFANLGSRRRRRRRYASLLEPSSKETGGNEGEGRQQRST